MARHIVHLLVATIVLSQFLAAPSETKEDRIDVEMRNFRFYPDRIQLETGESVTIRVYNNDSAPHTLTQDEYDIHIGTRTTPLQGGESASVSFTADRNGTFWFYCNVLGHSDRRGDGSYGGMAGRLAIGVPIQDDGPAPIPPAVTVGGGLAVVAAAILVYTLWRRR